MVEQFYNAITYHIANTWDAIVCRILGHDWRYFTMQGYNGTGPQRFRRCVRCERMERIRG